MTANSLRTFTETVSPEWGSLTSELVARCRERLARLLHASANEDWLAALHLNAPPSTELYRDPMHGFLLIAHTEQTGMYRPPHDHGRGWVLYAVQRGEMEMSSYRRLHDLHGSAHLVRRETFVLSVGDVRVFLPGDIHDTRCTAGPLTLFRLTSRDFKNEEVTRYPDPHGAANAASSVAAR